MDREAKRKMKESPRVMGSRRLSESAFGWSAPHSYQPHTHQAHSQSRVKTTGCRRLNTIIRERTISSQGINVRVSNGWMEART